MPLGSSWMPYSPQGVKGIVVDDDDATYVILNKNSILAKYSLIVPILK